MSVSRGAGSSATTRAPVAGGAFERDQRHVRTTCPRPAGCAARETPPPGPGLGRVRLAVEKQHLTPPDGARATSSIAATLFGCDEFILREISPETLLFAPSRR